jgi:hypothetical protein
VCAGPARRPALPPVLRVGRSIDAHRTDLDQCVADLVRCPEDVLGGFAATAGKAAAACDLLSIKQIVSMYQQSRGDDSHLSESVTVEALTATGRACRYPKGGLVRIPGHAQAKRLWAIRNADQWARRSSGEWAKHFAVSSRRTRASTAPAGSTAPAAAGSTEEAPRERRHG